MNNTDATVFVVDDDDGVRKSLAWLLESVNLSCQQYRGGEAFLAHYQPGALGCVLMDVRMPQMDGLEVNKRLKNIDPEIPVLIVTGHADVPMATQAMREGAFDLIEKPYNDNYLLERIQAAIDAHQEILKKTLSKIESVNLLRSLTPRENEVLEGVFHGKTNREISEDLEVSIKTVELHRANLIKKLGATGTADLVRIAAERGLLEL